MSAEAKLEELKITLPPPPPPGGIYKPIVYVGNIAYVSGHGPMLDDGTFMSGKVGSDYDLEGAQNAARQTGLSLLATIRANLGSLDKVKRVIKLLGMVNATSEYRDHPQVINGCSGLFREIWGEDGVGARSAVGMGSLPGNIPVEIEIIIEIEQ